MPKVSVVIPTYNYGRFIAESIDSVLAQDFTDFEVIVVDDGSTDNTQAILARYADCVRCIRQENAGSAAARNTGIAHAKGELIAFHDADDIWLPHCLSRRVEMMERYPELDMVFGDVVVVRGNEVLFRSFLDERRQLRLIPARSDDGCRFIFTRSLFPYLLRERLIPTPTVLIRRECLARFGAWDPVSQDQEDYEFQIRISKCCTIGYINELIATCRMHGANITSKIARQNEQRIAVLNQYRHDPTLHAWDRYRLRLRISNLHLEAAWYYRISGNMSSARKHYLLSFRDNWLQPRTIPRYLALRAYIWLSNRKLEPVHPSVPADDRQLISDDVS